MVYRDRMKPRCYWHQCNNQAGCDVNWLRVRILSTIQKRNSYPSVSCCNGGVGSRPQLQSCGWRNIKPLKGESCFLNLLENGKAFPVLSVRVNVCSGVEHRRGLILGSFTFTVKHQEKELQGDFHRPASTSRRESKSEWRLLEKKKESVSPFVDRIKCLPWTWRVLCRVK